MAREPVALSPKADEPEIDEVVETPPEPHSRKNLNWRTLLTFIVGYGILALVRSRNNLEAVHFESVERGA